MVATPLVALGLTNPKNHDFLGSAQQSIMMYVSTCLRPVLIVISFFIAVNLTFVSFDYLNYVFFQAFGSILATISGDVGAEFALPVIFAGMLVYSYFCMSVLMYVLEIINDIPDKISRWIGGTMLNPGGNVRQIISEAKGGVGAHGHASLLERLLLRRRPYVP